MIKSIAKANDFEGEGEEWTCHLVNNECLHLDFVAFKLRQEGTDCPGVAPSIW